MPDETEAELRHHLRAGANGEHLSDTMPTPTRAPAAAAYRLLIVGVEIDGAETLAYGEAVEVVNLPPQPLSVATLPVATPSGRTVTVRVLRETITATTLADIEGRLSGPTLSHGPLNLRHGRLVRRSGMLAPPRASGDEYEGISFHPDGKFTYNLDEWWDAEETTVAQMWESRAYSEIGHAIGVEIGLQLHHASDRIGNFLRFERLSNWWIDSQPDPFSHDRWVRAIHDGPNPGTPLQLHLRFTEGTETATEEVIELAPSGRRVASASDYSRISLSLFDARSGRLLASDSGALLGNISVAIELSPQGTVQDNAGVSHQVTWPAWPSGAPHRGIHPDRPWLVRAGHRALRNDRLRERSSVVLFEENQRADMLTRLREIVANRTAEFLDVWDPYLDGPGVRDILSWLNPGVPCRVLCGGRSNHSPATDTKVSDLVAAVTALRNTPPGRAIEGRYRVRRRGRDFVPIFHDRFLITRDAAWMLGASLNHIGEKPGGIVRLLDPARVRWLFDDAWNRALPSDIVERRL